MVGRRRTADPALRGLFIQDSAVLRRYHYENPVESRRRSTFINSVGAFSRIMNDPPHGAEIIREI